ncbi:MAG TPA: hypothetical protein VIK75_10145 [Calditerricola sp.]
MGIDPAEPGKGGPNAMTMNIRNEADRAALLAKGVSPPARG